MLAGSFRGNAVVDDHKLLFERALARDAEGARQIITSHVQRGVEHILKEPGFLLNI
ncbi:hypothetical protein D1872_331020 [compost metagenome]